MGSLKEIKRQINSVKSTQKITSAMKMVASAKLRKAQSRIDSFLPYQRKLDQLLNAFLSSLATDFSSGLAETREVKRVAIVALSSNSSLCGAFNSNILRLLKETIHRYAHLNPADVEIYAIGKKIEEQVRKLSLLCPVKGNYIALMDKPYFEGAKQIAQVLIQDFLDGRIDKVELLYNHYKNTASQVPTLETYLPISLKKGKGTVSVIPTDYIIEPDRETLLHSLIPKSLHSKIYAVLLDSAAAEQAARVIAMQIATDNAGEILDDLTLQYNKQRQQAITSELLDIIGGSEALK
jgi:F-type H+-transporting ATPase subunit gamma